MSSHTPQTRIEFGSAYVVVDGEALTVLQSLNEAGEPNQNGSDFLAVTRSGGAPAYIRRDAITAVWQLTSPTTQETPCTS